MNDKEKCGVTSQNKAPKYCNHELDNELKCVKCGKRFRIPGKPLQKQMTDADKILAKLDEILENYTTTDKFRSSPILISMLGLNDVPALIAALRIALKAVPHFAKATMRDIAEKLGVKP
jgi:hypothetical protein